MLLTEQNTLRGPERKFWGLSKNKHHLAPRLHSLKLLHLKKAKKKKEKKKKNRLLLHFSFPWVWKQERVAWWRAQGAPGSAIKGSVRPGWHHLAGRQHDAGEPVPALRGGPRAGAGAAQSAGGGTPGTPVPGVATRPRPANHTARAARPPARGPPGPASGAAPRAVTAVAGSGPRRPGSALRTPQCRASRRGPGMSRSERTCKRVSPGPRARCAPAPVPAPAAATAGAAPGLIAAALPPGEPGADSGARWNAAAARGAPRRLPPHNPGPGPALHSAPGSPPPRRRRCRLTARQAGPGWAGPGSGFLVFFRVTIIRKFPRKACGRRNAPAR